MNAQNLYLRPIALHDLPLVVDLERRSHSHPWSEKNFNDALNAGYLAIGLWANAQLLGFAWVMTGVDEAELLDIVVAPEVRRQSLGQHLLQACEQRVKTMGKQAIYLEVRPSNIAARALYAQSGYAEVGLRVGYYPAQHGREDALLMKKVL